MEHQVTRLPPTTMATRRTSAAPADDLYRLIRVRQAWIDGHQAINAEMLAFWQSRLRPAWRSEDSCSNALPWTARWRSSWTTPKPPCRRTSISRRG
jgi:hypothetical protein